MAESFKIRKDRIRSIVNQIMKPILWFSTLALPVALVLPFIEAFQDGLMNLFIVVFTVCLFALIIMLYFVYRFYYKKTEQYTLVIEDKGIRQRYDTLKKSRLLNEKIIGEGKDIKINDNEIYIPWNLITDLTYIKNRLHLRASDRNSNKQYVVLVFSGIADFEKVVRLIKEKSGKEVAIHP